MIESYDENLSPNLAKSDSFNAEKEVICPDCKGDFEELSDCCGASMDSDMGLCSDCHDHCEAQVCETCLGKGTIII